MTNRQIAEAMRVPSSYLSKVLQSLGRPEDAVGHFERAIELTPGRPDVVEHLRGLIESTRP